MLQQLLHFARRESRHEEVESMWTGRDCAHRNPRYGECDNRSIGRDQLATGSFGVHNGGLLGEFTDHYTFSIADGSAFDMSAFISTGFSNRYGINDLVGSLFRGSTLLFSADAVIHTLPEGFPSSDLTIAPFLLGAGDYRLVLTGNAYGVFEGPTASYSGDISFAAASTSVPEPETLLLFMTGLIAAAAMARSRSGLRPAR
jgi:hypothetical protein